MSAWWGDVSVWVDVGCPTPAHRRALWIASANGALPMPTKPKPRASSMESVDIAAPAGTPSPKPDAAAGAVGGFPLRGRSQSMVNIASVSPTPEAAISTTRSLHPSQRHDSGVGKDEDVVDSRPRPRASPLPATSPTAAGAGTPLSPVGVGVACYADGVGGSGAGVESDCDAYHAAAATMNALLACSSLAPFTFGADLRRVSGSDVKWVIDALLAQSFPCFDRTVTPFLVHFIALLRYVLQDLVSYSRAVSLPAP